MFKCQYRYSNVLYLYPFRNHIQSKLKFLFLNRIQSECQYPNPFNVLLKFEYDIKILFYKSPSIIFLKTSHFFLKVPVPQPYPVQVPVDRPYPVHVPVPQPVPCPVQVPVQCPVPQPYPVQVPVPVPWYVQ
jgi:hypothetical protein